MPVEGLVRTLKKLSRQRAKSVLKKRCLFEPVFAALVPLQRSRRLQRSLSLQLSCFRRSLFVLYSAGADVIAATAATVTSQHRYGVSVAVTSFPSATPSVLNNSLDLDLTTVGRRAFAVQQMGAWASGHFDQCPMVWNTLAAWRSG